MKLEPTTDEMLKLADLERAGWERRAVEPLPLSTLDLAKLSNTRAIAKQFAIEQIAPLAEVTLFTGPGSAGKSLLGQQLATAAAAGQNCLGLGVQPGPAIYLTCEDDADQLHWRQQHLCDAMGVPMASLAGKLHLISRRGALDTPLCTFASDGTLERQPACNRIEEMIRATGSKLVFLDNVAHLFTGNENDRGQVTRFINLLNRLAGNTGAAILLIAHPNKSGDNYSGSTAWLNAVRSQVTIDLQRDADGAVIDADARVLTTGKANYSRLGEAVRFRWHKWAFVREEDLPADTRAELADVIKANDENAAFLKCLAISTERKKAVSENPGTNYFGSVFCKMPEGRKYTRAAFERAFERLLSLGKIQLDAKLWQRENRSWKYGIKCTDPPAPTPCTDPHSPLSQVVDIACTDLHAPTPLYTTYITGQAFGPPARDLDSEEWSKL